MYNRKGLCSNDRAVWNKQRMVQARGGVQITLREIPNYGVVVVDPFSFLRVEVGVEPLLLSIDDVDIKNTQISELIASLSGDIGTSISLELLSSDLSRREKVLLCREDFDAVQPLKANSLKDSLMYLDAIDETDWSGHALQLAETAAATTLDPVGSALFNSAIKLSREWFDSRTFLHFFTQTTAARYFDSIYKVDDANFAIEAALESLPNFDCLDFDESARLFEFAGYLIDTQRVSQASFLLNELAEAAKNSIHYDVKMLACLKLKQRITPLETIDFLNNLFDKKKFSLSHEDLHFVADNFLANGDYTRAVSALGLLSTQSTSASHDFELRDFIQPSTYALFIQAFAYKSNGDSISAQISLKTALTTYQSNFSDDQLKWLDELPGLFPKPKDIEGQISGILTPLTARLHTQQSFSMKLRAALDALQSADMASIDLKIEQIVQLAYKQSNVQFTEAVTFTCLLNLARQP